MTKEALTKQAYKECCSEATTAHHGGGCGRPFWNAEAFQFMYVPSFQFQSISGCKKYRFTAKDENGNIHTFDAPKPSALLTEIWGELPEGVVELTVRTVNDDNSEGYLVGARTFYKLAPFCADLPEAKCSYKECATRAYDYIMNLSYVRFWLDNGVPDPNYILNVYPSKTHSAIIGAMLNMMTLCPDKADDALKIARNAADYLMEITPNDNSPLNGVPPTYKLDYCEIAWKHFFGTVVAERSNTIMMIYPSYVGKAYLQLEEKTKEQKYLDAAIKIGEFYLSTVQKNGTWYIIIDDKTGEPVSYNYCDPMPNVVPFLMKLYERTGEEKWKTLSDNAISYIERETLMSYNWEGQFEDSGLSANYSNLTHFGAAALVRHYAAYYSDDENKMKIAEDVARFIEDQFVVWNKPAPWNKDSADVSLWPVPCALEQYNWYVPIDASSASVINTFIALYKAGRGELYLAKAKALTDTITRVQHDDGMIPTHWMDEETLNGHNFWINCMIATANTVEAMAEFTENN
ncbi:MAG: hypothetical protein KBT46_06045 [Ruminococcus sp.]|nr:hypothetical protein [Candidatus Copronaster equi]